MGSQISPFPSSPSDAVAYPTFAVFVVKGNTALSVFADCRLAMLPPNSIEPSSIMTYSQGLDRDSPSKPIPEFGPPAPSGLWPIMAALSRFTVPPNSADSSHLLEESRILSFSSMSSFLAKFSVMSKFPSFPPVPSIGANFTVSPVSTKTASSQAMASSGRVLRHSRSSDGFVLLSMLDLVISLSLWILQNSLITPSIPSTVSLYD